MGESQKDLQNALSRFNKAVKKAEIIEQVYDRREYLKPSRKKKLKRERAIVKKIRQEKLDQKKNRNLNT
jgi:ribosomal protein S21